ncbi:MAG: hypothetical protein J7L21_05060, partial [Sulfurimonas sp.]|nr:hypothetical protein [Sulfurimonas sp.]
MIRLLFLGLLILTNLVSSDFNTSDTGVITPKVLYLSYKESPSRVLKGEIFSITIKTLSTVENFTDVIYEFSNYYGLEALNTTPYRDSDSKYYYDTFHFLTTSSNAKLPDITASLSTSQEELYRDTTLIGSKLNVITLNPKKNFSNIIANSFEIAEYKTTSYDNTHNII